MKRIILCLVVITALCSCKKDPEPVDPWPELLKPNTAGRVDIPGFPHEQMKKEVTWYVGYEEFKAQVLPEGVITDDRDQADGVVIQTLINGVRWGFAFNKPSKVLVSAGTDMPPYIFQVTQYKANAEGTYYLFSNAIGRAWPTNMRSASFYPKSSSNLLTHGLID